MHAADSMLRTALHRWAALVVGAAACAVLLGNTATWLAQTDYAQNLAYRRLWSDQALAITDLLARRRPLSAQEEASLPGDAATHYREILIDRIERRGIEPVQFWRTIPDRPFRQDRRRIEPLDYDDPGRARLLAFGFRVLGGIAPYLILWLGAFACIPVLLWTAAELMAAGRPLAAGALPLLLACSPYCVETLALSRYAVGFYLVGLLLLVPLASYAWLHPAPTTRGLLVRALAAGPWFAVCALCRSSTLLLLAGYALAFLAGFKRTLRTGRHSIVAALAGLAVLSTPYVLLREPRAHDVWQPLWEGLGDFDRTRGHAWSDPVALDVVRREGGSALWTPESERIFRRLVLSSIREDPAWYVAILARRAWATVSLSKLWPWSPRDGLWMTRSSSPNEGFLDKYYTYTHTVDFLGFGRLPYLELPVSVIVLPTAFLLLLAAWTLSAGGAAAHRATASLGLLGCVAAAAVLVPVLVTTAGAQETQAFALVYALGLALLLEEVRVKLTARAPTAAPLTPPRAR